MTEAFTFKCGLCSRRCEEHYLYVLEDPIRGASRIGMSLRPVRRYGKHRKKTGKHVILVEYRPAGCKFETARRERVVINKMTELFERLNGDWFVTEPQRAVDLMLEAIAS